MSSQLVRIQRDPRGGRARPGLSGRGDDSHAPHVLECEKRHPGRVESVLRALTDVRPSDLLDRKLFDFASLK